MQTAISSKDDYNNDNNNLFFQIQGPYVNLQYVHENITAIGIFTSKIYIGSNGGFLITLHSICVAISLLTPNRPIIYHTLDNVLIVLYVS